MKINAAILVISHKHGIDYDLYRTQEEAFEALYNYVAMFWGDAGDDPIPRDQQEAIDAYFNAMVYNEWWEIAVRTLDLSGSDLTTLTSNEEEIK